MQDIVGQLIFPGKTFVGERFQKTSGIFQKAAKSGGIFCHGGSKRDFLSVQIPGCRIGQSVMKAQRAAGKLADKKRPGVGVKFPVGFLGSEYTQPDSRQKKEGELEADGALKLYITLFSGEKHSVVTRIEAGDPIAENDSAFSVYIPAAGDGLWDVAKKLRKTPEEVQRCNADLEYPLTGKERIVIYRKKQVKF